MYGMYHVVLDKVCDIQVHSLQSAGSVRLDINLFKPCRLEFPAEVLATQREEHAKRSAETGRRRRADGA